MHGAAGNSFCHMATLTNLSFPVRVSWAFAARVLNEDRVRIAHGFWIVAEDSGQLLHGRKGELDPASHFNEAQAIARKADLMNSLNYQLREILKDWHRRSSDQD